MVENGVGGLYGMRRKGIVTRDAMGRCWWIGRGKKCVGGFIREENGADLMGHDVYGLSWMG